eukprot:scaffold166852_cov32-Tisochrysis_lutea.AAC.2
MPARALSGQKAKLRFDMTASKMFTLMISLSSWLSEGTSRGSPCSTSSSLLACCAKGAAPVLDRRNSSKALMLANTDSPFTSRNPPISVSRRDRRGLAAEATLCRARCNCSS